MGKYLGYESEGSSVVSDSLWPHGLYSSWNSPGQNTGVGSLSLLGKPFLKEVGINTFYQFFGKSHGRRGLIGCSPWGRWKLDTSERLYFHFSLSWREGDGTGEGNGNPLQCSYLENPRDGGTWWAAVSGVTQSRTWLKRLSSSSSINSLPPKFHMDYY